MKQASAVIRFSDGLCFNDLFAETAGEGGERQRFLLLLHGLAAELLKAVDAELRLRTAGARAALDPANSFFNTRSSVAFACGLHFLALGFEFEIFGVICGILIEGTVLQFHNAVGDPLEKIPIVRDRDDGPVEFCEKVLEPQDGVHIDVVRRFVQNEQAGVSRESGGERRALLLAAGKLGDVLIQIAQAKARQQRAAFVFRRVSRSGVQHGLPQNGQSLGELRILRQISCAQSCHARDAAAVRCFETGQDFEQGGFSCPVDADQADPIALVDRERYVFKQRFLAVAFADGFRREINVMCLRPPFHFSARCVSRGAFLLYTIRRGKAKAFRKASPLKTGSDAPIMKASRLAGRRLFIII